MGGVARMSPSALAAEKQRVKLELQRYDYCFHLLSNRFPTAVEKEPIQGIYRYYRHLRELLACIAKGKAECECALFRPPPGLSLPAEVAAPPGLSPIGSSTSAGTSPSASENSGSKHDRE